MKNNIIFGTATSAYQIEGRVLEEGACSSNWHEFALTPGKIRGGDTGELACDHYNRYRDDVLLMNDLGFDAYRFSISWSRILPANSKNPNERGVSFYDKLIDKLLKHNITPYLTIFHWDLPLWVSALGGWANRVKNWITLNEPWCVSFLGYWEGKHAPGIEGDFAQVLSTTHHQLLAHGLVVKTFRASRACKDGRIGISLNPFITYPADLLRKINREYTRSPIIITENGYPLEDNISEGEPIEIGKIPPGWGIK